MAELSLSPAMTVAMSVVVAMVSLVLLILCVLRRKNTDCRTGQLGEEDTAFDEYRKQQQARSLEDLAPGQSDVPRQTRSLEDLVFTDSVETENQANIAAEQGNHTETSRVMNLPGGDLIDQYPDQQHIYRLDPTENIQNSVSSATGYQGQRPVTMAIGENTARGQPRNVTVEYAKVNKKPKTSEGQSHEVTAEYAKVNKKPKLPDKKNGGIRASMPASVYELERNAIARVDSQNASTGQRGEYDNVRNVVLSPYIGNHSLEVPNMNQTHSLSPPNRHISTRSTASYMSDFQDCTEFRRDPPGK